MKNGLWVQLSFILFLTLITGIIFNLSNTNRIPFIGEERKTDFSSSDSLLEVLRIQDSLQKIADSLSKISQYRLDSVKQAQETRIKDSLEALRKADSVRKVQDSLRQSTQKPEDTVRADNTVKQEFVKPVDIRLNFAKALFDKGYTFIDSRDVVDYNAGHIKGALNIPYKEISSYKSRLESMDKNIVYVIYCSKACDVSIDMAYYMARMGFKKVYIFHGGWDEWMEAGYPSD